MISVIYKVVSSADWASLQDAGGYAGSPDDLRDGYIHFSTRDQLAVTLDRHFSGKTGLVLLAIDVERLGGELKWEPARNGQLFPHLYGTLNRTAVVRDWALSSAMDGRHNLPEDLN
jgi:uncharacterized protein (DUF952 family)